VDLKKTFKGKQKGGLFGSSVRRVKGENGLWKNRGAAQILARKETEGHEGGGAKLDK